MTLVTELWAPNSWIWITKYPSQKLFLSIFFVFADWQSENKSAISSSVKTTNRGVSAMIVVCTIDSKREALVCFSIVRGASVYWPYNSIIRSVDAGAPGDLESYSWRIIAVVCQGLANHKRSIGFINIKRITIYNYWMPFGHTSGIIQSRHYCRARLAEPYNSVETE